jgi:phosphoribosyl 1,2-cyclic phosphodiesterase
MRFCTLASGSKANAVLVETGVTRLLIDCGLGPRALARRLLEAGIAPGSISAVVLTHEHTDHVKGVAQAVAKWRWPVIGTAGTLAGVGDVPPDRHAPLAYGQARAVGDCTIELVAVPHDAAQPAAVVITSAHTGARIGIATDLGHVPEALAAAFERLDFLVLESNHCELMLRNGPYPPFLQARIASEQGHLSNRQTGALLQRVAHRGLRHVVLAHLSQQNNTPEVALDAARVVLKATAFKGTLACAEQDAVTHPRGAPVLQLGLAI